MIRSKDKQLIKLPGAIYNNIENLVHFYTTINFNSIKQENVELLQAVHKHVYTFINFF